MFGVSIPLEAWHAAQNKQTPKPPPACPSHVSFFRVTGFVAEQEALHFTLCFQKRQGPHVLTCIGKLWLAACSARVWEAPTSKVSTTLLGATFAVAADPGLLPLPSSEDCVEPSPDEEAELLAEPSDSDTAARGDAFAVAAGSGLLPRPSSSLSPAAEAAELLAEASGSDAPSLETVAATGVSGEGLAEALALGEGLGCWKNGTLVENFSGDVAKALRELQVKGELLGPALTS